MMRILVYGAGVIGSLYATLFSESGYDVTVYARGRRLSALQKKGLLYFKKGVIKKADVHVLDHLEEDDVYDFIILSVRAEQAKEALFELSKNKSRNIVTMINTIADYSDWESLCGKGRLLPAFPGAGGGIQNDILYASLTPAWIQPTTFGEINGHSSSRQKTFAKILHKCHIPYQIVSNMHNWQLSHLALVVPLADAYLRSSEPEHVYRDRRIMWMTAKALKRNMRFFAQREMLSPEKLKLILLCPLPVMAVVLKRIFKSHFGYTFMYKHAMKAPDEMKLLHKELYMYMIELIKADTHSSDSNPAE